MQILKSEEDRSVNFVLPNGQECRYVRRNDEKFIVYISSHNGCDKACRFCHLTQTGQTQMVPSTFDEMVDQAKIVLEHYKKVVAEGLEPPAKRVHFNWMARGEPMLNQDLRYKWEMLEITLRLLAQYAGINEVKYKVSTIMPVGLGGGPDLLFDGDIQPELYYSLYSLSPFFRKRWLPKAGDPTAAAYHLHRHMKAGGKVVFHWALIKDENDNDLDAIHIAKWIKENGFEHCRFNLVRYNPYSPLQGQEPNELVMTRYFNIISSAFNNKESRIIPRVGFDVAASCGMFVDIP